MAKWRLIDSGPGEASFNMALDQAIAESVIKKRSLPTLRFYSWNGPSVSLGYFQGLKEIEIEFCRRHNIPVVKRPTGGRAILHTVELTYSFCSPYNGIFNSKGLYETYRAISLCFVEALRRLGLPVLMEEKRRARYGHNPLCFMSTSYGEVSLFGIKILGSAQRRFKEGFLQQGSLPYFIDRELMKGVFRITPEGLSGLYEILEKEGLKRPEEEDLKSEIIKAFERRFQVSLIREGPSEDELITARRIEGLGSSDL